MIALFKANAEMVLTLAALGSLFAIKLL